MGAISVMMAAVASEEEEDDDDEEEPSTSSGDNAQWVKAETPQGRTYYYNVHTLLTSWTDPTCLLYTSPSPRDRG